ncbi:hypothetical protein TSTA_062160 [Talaromyces stipitatus ATCC 10500]|uniref:Protein kinase domain-containing protein n=1 Tax=Talaromyces stipitatus (strain ATCC 10500 / CBS 375.48 / QM 6759 / NRRL 1006) TaxID=441959 RepID=B8LX78_TALSN|nr:uncharacterized protein TSTA_062160 [Talaromyces stipitatus ATCC 10500]EED22728.1 hypothetical protein TSTA_062160 [Talaromyces stipitatus ATCC 10500]
MSPNTKFGLASGVDQIAPIQFPSRRKYTSISNGQGGVLETMEMNPYLPPRVKHHSPWEDYRKEFGCELAGDAVAVIHKREPSKVFLLRCYPQSIGDQMLQWFTQLRHPNIMSAKECFSAENSFYALCEDLPLTLEHLIVCRAYPTEAQLALILKQVILSSLFQGTINHEEDIGRPLLPDGGKPGPPVVNCLQHSNGARRGREDGWGCSLEDIRSRNQNRDQRETLNALATVTMELMEKHTRKSDAPGVNDLDRWPADSNAVKFLATIESARNVDELSKTRVVKVTVPTESFFNFFSPPKPPADEDDAISDIEERLELDYQDPVEQSLVQ